MQLVYRVERCKEASPANGHTMPHPIHVWRIRQTPRSQRPCQRVVQNKRATVSLGYIGCIEAAAAFLVVIGKMILKQKNSR